MVETKLPNGLHVLVVNQPGVPMVEFCLGMPFFPEQRSQLAVVELLCASLKGGTSERSAEKIDDDLAVAGGTFRANFDRYQVLLSGYAFSNKVENLIDTLSHLVQSSSYPSDVVNLNRSILIRQAQVTESRMDRTARRGLRKKRYKNSALIQERPHPSDMAEVEVGEVRSLDAEIISPRNSTLVIVGDIEPRRTVEHIINYLSPWGGEVQASPSSIGESVGGRGIEVLDKSDADQSLVLLLGTAVPQSDPRYAALALADLVFGGYFSSRLNRSLRGRSGYAYAVASGFEFTPWSSDRLISVQTRVANTVPAIESIQHVLEDFCEYPPSDEEVEAARRYAKGMISLSLSSQGGIVSSMIHRYSLGIDIDCFEAHLDRISTVTQREVAEIGIDFYDSSNFFGIVMGDRRRMGDVERIPWVPGE